MAESSRSNKPLLLNSDSSSSSSFSSSFLILDGGMGREIERRGGPFRQPEWSALALYEQPPSIVQDVHLSYLKAGAQVIITNSYAVVPFHIGQERYDNDSKRLLQLAVRLATNARKEYYGNDSQQQGSQPPPPPAITKATKPKPPPLVLGSIPPICGSYQPELFDPKVCEPILDDFMNAYTTTTTTTSKDGCGNEDGSAEDNIVDGIILETIGSSQEARFYLERILDKFKYRNKRIWISFCLTVEYGYDQPPHLVSGEKLSTALHNLKDLIPLIEVVCVNCCDMRLITPAIKELKQVFDDMKASSFGTTSTNTPYIGVYPNAFTIPPPDAANLTLRPIDYNISPIVFQNMAKEWIKAGAKVIGGCCGVSPQHIQALRDLQQQLDNPSKSDET